MPIDIRQHQRNDNYDAATFVRRILWGLAQPLFRWSPRHLNAWRRALLRVFGARVGARVVIYPSARVMYPWTLEIADDVVIAWGVNLYSLGPIHVGDNVLISQGAHLCSGTHDYRQPNYPLVRRPIVIESGTWLAAECFIGPGVTVGAGAVVGARAVVMRDVAPRAVVAGNPARVVGQTP